MARKLVRKDRVELAKKAQTVAAFNTVLQTLILRFLGSDTIITDFIMMGTGNYILYETVKNHSDKMGTQLKEAYLPVTSSLYFAMYSGAVKGNSYITSIASSIPVAVAETILL